jgi:hypothetical protein
MTDFLPILPDWVLIEAAKRCGRCHWRIVDLTTGYRNDRAFRALCDMIAKHEQPPVDRKLLCAREAAWPFGFAKDSMGVDACVRAIELYESGFGK